MFADDSSKFDEYGRKFTKWVENTVGKGEIAHNTSNFSFSHSVFKRPVSHGRQKVSLCGNGLTFLWQNPDFNDPEKETSIFSFSQNFF